MSVDDGPIHFLPRVPLMTARLGVMRQFQQLRRRHGVPQPQLTGLHQPMAGERDLARARVLGNAAVQGLNTLFTSYSKRRGASDYSFSKRPFTSHDQRSSYAFSFSNQEQRRIQNDIFMAAVEYQTAVNQQCALDGEQTAPTLDPLADFDKERPFFENSTEYNKVLSAYGVPAGDHASSAPQSVVAGRVSLPPRDGPPPIDIRTLLPSAEAELYSSPENLLLDAFEQAKVAKRSSKRSCTLISSDEYSKLCDELFIRGMITFKKDAKVINGLFAVPKQDDVQRLIADLRKANSHFAVPAKVTLCGPDIISKIQVPTGQRLVQATRDIRDFYHRLAMPPSWWPYFAWQALDVSRVPSAAAQGLSGMMYPCLVSLPMGFSHSVRIAQLVHERVLHEMARLPRQNQILPHNDLRLRPGRILYSVYIDDTWFVCLYDPSDPESSKLVQLLARYEQCLVRIGTPDKPSKRVGPLLAAPCDVLGMQVDGKTLFFGMGAPKLEALKRETRKICASQLPVSGKELARILGKWNWAFLARRPAMSVFAAAYLFARANENSSVPLWDSVRKELKVAVQIAPLLHTRLDLPWSGTVMASDASLTAGGVMAKTLSKNDRRARNLLNTSHQLLKRLPPLSVVDVGVREPTIQAVLDDPSPWRTLFEKDWETDGEHINSLEMRAAYVATRHALLRESSSPQRFLFLCDNTVCVCTITKGRCSSRNLLVRFRPIAALALATGSELNVVYIESDRNPADAPSRASQRRGRSIDAVSALVAQRGTACGDALASNRNTLHIHEKRRRDAQTSFSKHPKRHRDCP